MVWRLDFLHNSRRRSLSSIELKFVISLPGAWMTRYTFFVEFIFMTSGTLTSRPLLGNLELGGKKCFFPTATIPDFHFWRNNCHVEKFWDIMEKFWDIFGEIWGNFGKIPFFHLPCDEANHLRNCNSSNHGHGLHTAQALKRRDR